MLDRINPPDTFDIDRFSLPKPKMELLNNGIPIYQFHNGFLDLIHINIQIKGGAIYESKKSVASTCFYLLKESSSSKSGSEMDEILDYYGASWQIFTHLDHISIQWIIPKSNCEVLLPILTDILYHPEFKKDSLERQKLKKIKDLEYNELKYNYRATQLMFRTFFEENSPSGEILTKDHIAQIELQDLKDYYFKIINASNISVFIAGNIDLSLEKNIQNAFNSFLIGNPINPVSNFRTLLCPEIISDIQTDPIQSSLLICKRGISYYNEDRRAFSFLSTILGGYFGSRLMQNLREQHGFTYGIQCGSIYWKNESIFYIESDVTADKTKESIEQCFHEIDRLKKELVTVEELKIVKRYMQGVLLREIDGVVSIMKKYIFWKNFGLDETELETTLNTINNTNNEVLIKNANKYLQNEDFYTIIVGRL
jgi:zinc protease